jgi:hypothetical protein
MQCSAADPAISQVDSFTGFIGPRTAGDTLNYLDADKTFDKHYSSPGALGKSIRRYGGRVHSGERSKHDGSVGTEAGGSVSPRHALHHIYTGLTLQ